ncbi:MAG: LamG-like jellyroll fold domain-containing protein, partial [Maioricimonas sp. JB045]
AVGQPVHIAIVYHADGRIVGYRNGQPYGGAYQSNGPFEFAAGQTVVTFGLRHLPAVGNRLLSGRILQARLYDRALSAEELQATFLDDPAYVSESQILAALTDGQRESLQQHRRQIALLTGQVEALGPLPDAFDEQAHFAELARALFTFKEFIYVR